MKLPGWEKVTSAEQYRQMIEAEYYKLQAERSTQLGNGIGLEEIKLRLFLSLIERPVKNPNQISRVDSRANLLDENQAPSDQAA
jgi:hypothetical protein